MGAEPLVISEKGPRSYMEDRHVFLPSFEIDAVFCGVYDGHEGEGATLYATTELHKRFGFFLRSLDPQAALKEAYKKISEEVIDQSGACAATYYLKGGTVYYANVGDVRILVVGDSYEEQLSIDHRVDIPDERARILRCGGEIVGRYVYRGDHGFYGLMPTRTLGDHALKEAGVTAVPHTGAYNLKAADRYLVVASDGLFDVMSNEEVGSFFRRTQYERGIKEDLTVEVFEKHGGHDNLTVVALRLH